MKLIGILIASILLLNNVYAQQPGTATAEVHPSLTTYQCTSSGCSSKSSSVVLDANWRWIHDKNGYKNCFSGNWDSSLCPDGATCATNCAIEGADYEATYGIKTSGSSLALQYVTGSNAGSRVYLMKDDNTYEMFNLKNKEFTFDVDVSQLACGLNGALYFVEMPSDGGKSQFPTNGAGAKYGTGYCDAQCPQDVKFINGEANTISWNGNTGQYGACCIEMDIWEANSISTAFTPHPCTSRGLERCTGEEGCSQGSHRYGGICDKDGCDFNAYRMGDTAFYGPNKVVDTTKPITVVTQFITSDGTDNGDLVEMRRVYVQNGKVIPNTKSTWTGVQGFDSITDEFCTKSKTLFGDEDDYSSRGGMKTMGESFERGMVLVMSLWSDSASKMHWLDSTVPAGSSAPGAARGSCPESGGDPAILKNLNGAATVTFSNVKWGAIGSTTTAKTTETTKAPTTTTTTKAPSKAPTQAPVQETTTTTKAPTTTTTKAPTTTTTKAPTTTTTKAPTTTTTKAPTTTTTKAPAQETTTTTREPNKQPTESPVDETTTTSAPSGGEEITPNPVVGNVKLRVHEGSSSWWVAIAIENAAYDVSTIDVTDGSAYTSPFPLKYAEWGYWILPTSGTQLASPLNFVITAENGDVINFSLPTIRACENDLGRQFA